MYSIFDTEAMANFRREHKIDPYRVRQLFLYVFKHRVIDIRDIPVLPKAMRQKMFGKFRINTLSVQQIDTSADDTVKFLLRTHDGHTVEMVLMYHFNQRDTSVQKIQRITLCISTQIGCPVGCAFCVTGKLGLTRNLHIDEIMSQILLANHYLQDMNITKEDGTVWTVRNVVYMGMGEPFLNYDAVMATLPYLSDPKYLGLSNRRITISTIGIVPKIKQFADANPPASLAFSLHAPTQELREQLVPFAKQFPLPKIMSALKYYTNKTQKQVFVEYVLLKDKNDTDGIAHQVGKLLGSYKCHVNLIPYNDTPTLDFTQPDEKRIKRFKGIIESYNITVTLRGTMGRKSKGACGQLGWDQVQGDYVVRRENV